MDIESAMSKAKTDALCETYLQALNRIIDLCASQDNTQYSHSDFADIVKAFSDANGIVVSDEPGQVASELLADSDRAQQLAEAGRNVILSRQGATKRTAEMIMNLLNGNQ